METIDARDLLRDAPLRLIAERLRQARNEAGLTLDGLAAAAYTSRQHLINLEKGNHRPRLDMLAKIAEATGKTVDFFVSSEVDTNNGPFRDAA